MSKSSENQEICKRIGEIRRKLHGKRGKASFAKQLGISASTYNYYEIARVPRADLLVRIADAGGVGLRWLLTGQAARPAVPPDHPAIARIADLLADRPDAAAPLVAFVDLLAESLKWPAKGVGGDSRPAEAPAEAPAPATGSARGGEVPRPADTEARPAPPPVEGAGTTADVSRESWIPILGRSAAGVPQFWSDADDAEGVTTLGDLIARVARSAPRDVRPAVAADADGRGEGIAQLITLREPDDANVAEFVVAGRLKADHPDAFAVRIDGDSMAPEILHGDVVVCSPSSPAADGRAAVVQLDGQIGVTCKLFRRAGETVHLACINERYPPQSLPATGLVWALRVLARIREQ